MQEPVVTEQHQRLGVFYVMTKKPQHKTNEELIKENEKLADENERLKDCLRDILKMLKAKL